MLPFLAQGGVMALEDAVALAQALLRHPSDAEAALRGYSAARRERSYRVVAAAERNGRIYHLDGFRARIRDAALAAGGGALVMRGYDWLYGGPRESLL
jgi:salicylate hydroxylase